MQSITDPIYLCQVSQSQVPQLALSKDYMIIQVRASNVTYANCISLSFSSLDSLHVRL